jgi:hypothetical protein
MKTRGKTHLILALITIPFVMASCSTLAERQAKPAGNPPVITHSFASKEVSHGDPWKIYLEAGDPDGDMQRFVYTISRTGAGYRKIKYISIKETNGARLLGYLHKVNGLT